MTLALKSRARHRSEHGFNAFQALFRDQKRVWCNKTGTNSKFWAWSIIWNNLYYCTWVKNPTFTKIFFPKFVVLRFFERKREKKGVWLRHFRLSGGQSSELFDVFFHILTPKIKKIRPIHLFFEIKKLRQNAKRWLKSAITMAFFTIFWLFQA